MCVCVFLEKQRIWNTNFGSRTLVPVTKELVHKSKTWQGEYDRRKSRSFFNFISAVHSKNKSSLYVFNKDWENVGVLDIHCKHILMHFSWKLPVTLSIRALYVLLLSSPDQWGPTKVHMRLPRFTSLKTYVTYLLVKFNLLIIFLLGTHMVTKCIYSCIKHGLLQFIVQLYKFLWLHLQLKTAWAFAFMIIMCIFSLL